MILLLIAVFTAISGRPVNGLLLAVVAVCLAWDNARTRRRIGLTAAQPRERLIAARRPRSQAVAAVAAVAAAGLGFAAVVGSFARYSWPATVSVIGLAAVVVAIGWRGSPRSRHDPGELPRRGTALWAGLLMAAGLWELSALVLQPGLDTTSSAHPTISALTDPLLTSHAGRSVALAVWVGVGWFLVRR